MGLMLGVLGEGGVGKVLFSLEPEPTMDSNRIFFFSPHVLRCCIFLCARSSDNEDHGGCLLQQKDGGFFSPWKCCLKYCFHS